MRDLLKRWLASHERPRILLLRHGAVQAPGEEKRFIGQTDLPLNDRGRHQARQWRRTLTGLPLTDVVASDLQRCRQTARIIAADRPLAVMETAGLREIHLGAWEGMAMAQVAERWPAAYGDRGRDLANFRPPGGESFADLQQRVLPVFETAVQRSGGVLLVVAHAGVNRAILCHLLGMPVANLFRLAQEPAAMNLIDRQTGGWRLVALNLPPAERRPGRPGDRPQGPAPCPHP